MRSHHSLLGLALALIIIWIILRVALTVTGFALHLLWIAAIIFAIIWLFRHLTGNRPPPV